MNSMECICKYIPLLIRAGAVFVFWVVLTLLVSISPSYAESSFVDWTQTNMKVLNLRTDTMLSDYYEKLAQEQVDANLSRIPPEEFAKNASKIRKEYAKSLLMPKNYSIPLVTRMGDLEIDGVKVEKQLLQTRPGIYSMCLIYNPIEISEEGIKSPAVLLLPGHGDPPWPSGVQERALSFAKKGYIAMQIEPFGQAERGENFRWNEYHGSLATSYLFTVGESLLGCITADHISEITYLLSRPDVDASRLSVAGVSMGATHTLYLAALDTRVKAAVSVSVAPINQPVFAMGHHCLCDTIWQAYKIIPDDFLRSLVAPRAFMQIFPSTEWPTTNESKKANMNAELSNQDMLAKYSLIEEEINALLPYIREIYNLQKHPNFYKMTVVEGPHDFNKSMRETAAGWYAYIYGETKTMEPIPEPVLNPILGRNESIAALDFWHFSRPPKDALTPTKYLQKRILEKLNVVKRIPNNPDEILRIKSEVKSLLNVDLAVSPVYEDIGKISAGGLFVHKIKLTPQPGISLPLLVIEPVGASRKEAVLIMSPKAKEQVLATGLPEKLAREGKWVGILEPRGYGETTSVRGDGAYTGVADYVSGIAALKVGETLAGQFTKDMISAASVLKQLAGNNIRITARGERECGFVAVLAGAYSKLISEVESVEMLASYFSSRGYGAPYVYGDERGRNPKNQNPGGWKSMLPSVPHILNTADIPQIAAMVAPKPLRIINPKFADDSNLTSAESEEVFDWLIKTYQLAGKQNRLKIVSN